VHGHLGIHCIPRDACRVWRILQEVSTFLHCSRFASRWPLPVFLV
jgi:hypothetical protein